MKVKDILELAIIFLDKEELLDFSPFGETAVVPELEGKEIGYLKRCFNLVYNEVATGYLPILTTEEVKFENNILSYDSLSKSLFEIKKLENDGKNIKYSLLDTGIYAKTDRAIITYSYVPTEMDFSDDVFLFGGKLPARVLAYGVAMEYSLILGLHDDAELWESRYKNGLKLACSKKSEIRLPSRGWN